jgi:hydrogenase expression/formation protein HypE
MFYPPGKLPNAVLEKLLAGAERLAHDPRVLVGPSIGEDAAVLDMKDTCFVITSDPITFATDHLGWYAVQVNANDVAVRGARPRWFLAVLLLPEKHTDNTLVSTIFEQIYSACKAIGCVVIGGHTEITLGLNRPIVVGQMLGEVERERLVTTGGAKAGDTLLLTKGIAIEGSALLAREREPQLKALGISKNMLYRAKNLLFTPGIGVVNDALVANQVTRVHAMHDPTEGGLATGIVELAQAAGVGVWIELELIPILAECAAICSALGIDPLGTLASGALLLAVAPADTARVVEALARERIPCSQIGRIVPREEGLKLKTRDGVLDLPAFTRDEIAKALE